LVKAFEDGDLNMIQMIVNGLGEISHLCRPLKGKYCWEWRHTCYESSDLNAIRDHYCFNGRRLCICVPACLDNGLGSRFVPNINPMLAQDNGWKPAPGRGGKTRYETVEVVSITRNGEVREIIELN
jgi:hypothetical protein